MAVMATWDIRSGNWPVLRDGASFLGTSVGKKADFPSDHTSPLAPNAMEGQREPVHQAST